MDLTTMLERVVIVTGHYGTGKTNLAVNLALDLRRAGRKVVLADLDVVNPYFRTADFVELARDNDVELISSPYANSNLDLPGLTGAFDARIGGEDTLILDVGGDDAGAIALGRYAPRIEQLPYTMLCVVNRYRYLTEKPEDALEMLKQIESASRLKVDYIVNNSNLSYETTAKGVSESVEWSKQVAELAGKPLAFTALRRDIHQQMGDQEGFYPVDIYVKVPWAK